MFRTHKSGSRFNLTVISVHYQLALDADLTSTSRWELNRGRPGVTAILEQCIKKHFDFAHSEKILSLPEFLF
jgi:hypothetical protein